MFGLPSFPKFIVLVVVICAVYFWSRRNAVQSRGSSGNNQPSPARKGSAGPGANASNAKQKAIEDLVKCPSCGTYIAAGSSCACGKSHR
jgi:ribosomal protein L32